MLMKKTIIHNLTHKNCEQKYNTKRKGTPIFPVIRHDNEESEMIHLLRAMFSILLWAVCWLMILAFMLTLAWAITTIGKFGLSSEYSSIYYYAATILILSCAASLINSKESA